MTFDALQRSWRRTDQLLSMFSPDALRTRALPSSPPAVFVLGHLPAAAWAHAARGTLGLDPFDEDLDARFSGTDPGTDDWPELRVLLAYRDGVRERLAGLVAAEEDGGDVLAGDDPIWSLLCDREAMQQETLLALARQLEPRLLRSDSRLPALRTGPDPRPPRKIPVRAGAVTLGAGEVDVPAFLLEDLPVTVGRFAAFVSDGGYRKRAPWTDEDWAWRKESDLLRPTGWRKEGRDLQVRSLFAWHELEEVAGWPVLVSHAEACAFARWAGARLPTEAELRRAAYVDRAGEERPWPWGDGLADQANLGLRRAGREPVGSRRAGLGPWGHYELVGNAWEWTDTVLEADPGLETSTRSDPGCSAGFDGQHRVVFGGSWATADALARRSLRSCRPARDPSALAGFRLAWDG